MRYHENANFSDLNGKKILQTLGSVGDETVKFVMEDGSEYALCHEQSCCEFVAVEEIIGDMADLQDATVISAEEVSSEGHPAPDKEHVDSYTWTFYKIQTDKGSVTIRWLGESNGYYSESVDFVKTRG